MNNQLSLLPEISSWQLEDEIREIGRTGLAAARAALDEVAGRQAA